MMNQQPHPMGNYPHHHRGGGSSGGGGGDNSGMIQQSSIQNRLNFNNQPEPVVHEPAPHKQVNCCFLLL